MQLFGDPFPLLEDLESEELLLCLLCFFVQAGVLDRHAGLGREQDDGGLVVVGEHVGIALVRQIDVAVDPAEGSQRGAQE